VENKPNYGFAVTYRYHYVEFGLWYFPEIEQNQILWLSETLTMGANRDFLVLANQAHLSREELDKQLAALNTILFPVENWNAFCTANEI
ncbi:hypothetical protein, partial [Salmonella sp. M113]|uniref:hypothetical protein n=1 Tax=Salmonella sp. M113 TaxID=3240284 RepID=UPI00352B45A2